MSTLLTVGISLFATVASFFGMYNYMPLDWLQVNETPRFGSTITTINGSDTLSSSRSVINTNFSNLNTDKMELSTWYATTSAAQITTLGTITTGNWNATAIPVNKGGTGTTSPSIYMVMLGNGSNGLTMASSTGTSGQVFASNGAGAYPSFQTITTNTAADYTWTGGHIFTASSTHSATTSISASSVTNNALILNGVAYAFPSSQGSANQILRNDGSGNISWSAANLLFSTTSPNVAHTGATSYTGVIAYTIPANTLGSSGAVHGKYYVKWRSVSTSAKVLNMIYGSTTCATDTATPGATTDTIFEGYLDFVISANNATNSQTCTFNFNASARSQMNVGGASNNASITSNGSATEDSTTAKAVRFDITQNSSDAFTVTHGYIEQLK